MKGLLGLEDMNASERIGKAIENTDTYEQFFAALSEADAANLSPDIDHELCALYYARRLKSDTDKAIYRLVCAGIVEDWTVDFNQKMYTLTIRKKKPEEYVVALFEYVRRYHAEQRALDEVLACFGAKLKNNGEALSKKGNLDLPNRDIKNVLTKSLDFLIDFAYQEVAAKRRRAIGDMVEACNEYLDKESKERGAGNFALKEWIYLYFNSKYARAGYEAKLGRKTPEGISVNFSLLDDTDAGKNELSFERLLQYLDLMDWDTSGSNNDNIKHLRGAATRLLRDQTGNASLKLLKAFTLFVLASDNPELYQEAEQACIEGFKKFIPKDDPKAVETLIRQYWERTKKYMPKKDREKVRQFLDNLSNTLLLNHHLEWLKTFNTQFLKEFDHGHYKDLAGTAK